MCCSLYVVVFDTSEKRGYNTYHKYPRMNIFLYIKSINSSVFVMQRRGFFLWYRKLIFVLFLLVVHKPRSQVARATKALSVAPSICVSSVRSVLCCMLLAPRIVKWLLRFFWGVNRAPCFSAFKAVNDFFSATLFVYR